MCYSISTWLFQNRSLAETIDDLTHSDFRKIELSGSGSALMNAWEKDCRDVQKLFHRHDIQAVSVHCSRAGRVKLGSSNRDERQKCITENRNFLQRMSESGIGEFVLHPEGLDAPPESISIMDSHQQKSYYAPLVDSLQQLNEEARQLGIRLAVENMQSPASPFASIQQLLQLIENFDRNMGLCLDIGHSFLAGLDARQELQAALQSSRLFSLHLHNIQSEGHRDHILPENGLLDLPWFIETLDKSGFKGQRTIELRPSENPLQELRRAVQVFRTS